MKKNVITPFPFYQLRKHNINIPFIFFLYYSFLHEYQEKNAYY